MIAKIDKSQHAGDYQHMASYLEAVIGHKHTTEPSEPPAVVLDSDEVSDLAWIAEQVRKIK
jgi:hypothetical protein|tara:strand:- start:70 stop:252 length:183 start_codon:yes stop_codon:yes gene_type:complete